MTDSMTDPMMWQLQLDMLIAEANVYANEAMRLLHGTLEAWVDAESIEERAATRERMRAGYAKIDAWVVIQDEIQHHIHNAKGEQP